MPGKGRRGGKKCRMSTSEGWDWAPPNPSKTCTTRSIVGFDPNFLSKLLCERKPSHCSSLQTIYLTFNTATCNTEKTSKDNVETWNSDHALHNLERKNLSRIKCSSIIQMSPHQIYFRNSRFVVTSPL